MMRPRNYTAAVVAIALTALPSPVGAQGTKPPMSANEDVSEQSQEASPIIDEGEEAPQDNVQDILETMTTRLARERNQEGINALNSTPPNLPKALEAFQAAYSLNRDDVEVVNNLGFVYAELGNLTRAEPLLRRALEQSPERLVAHVNLADVLIEKGADAALGEAKTLLARARELAGNDPELITRQATVHRRLGEEASALRLYREAVDLDPDNHELFVTLGDYFRELARDDQAADWYTRVPKQSEFYVRAKERLEQLEVERAARRYGWSPATRAVSRRVKTFVRRADELLGRGQLVAAEELARQAVQEAPQYADSHRVLGDALAAQGQAALSTYLRGFAVEPSNADLVRRIALIYRQENRDAEASVLLSRALELRPDWSELQLDLALALRSSGDLPGALKQVNRFLNSGLDVPRAEEATNLQRELATLLKPEERPDEAPPQDVAECLNRARVLLSRGKSDAALATLECGEEAEVRRLRARILVASDRPAQARKVLERVVEQFPADSEAHYELGLLRRSAGEFEGARTNFASAEAQGMHDATYQLAELDYREGDLTQWPTVSALRALLRARRRFVSYLERSGGTFSDGATRRLEQIDQLALQLLVSTILVLTPIMLIFVVWYRRRFGGHDLRTFLRKKPEAGAEVQTVLAAIRHEVLKHHTTALEGLLAALRRMDEVDDDLRRFERALFDDTGGVARRLQHYVDELERIGRRYELRVNLRARDSVIGALLEGFLILEKARPLLAKPRPKQRRALIRSLDRASRRLNDEAYRAVHDLLRELRELVIDDELLHGIGVRAAAEPGLRGQSVSPIEVLGSEELPRSVLVPRSLFEDILTNLLRNALQASAKDGANPIEVAIGAHIEDDDLTGVSYLTLTVFDHVQRTVDYSMIENASIESGLGIAREAASRCNAHLSPALGRDGYAKGVSIAFIVAEAEELVEDDWEMAS